MKRIITFIFIAVLSFSTTYAQTDASKRKTKNVQTKSKTFGTTRKSSSSSTTVVKDKTHSNANLTTGTAVISSQIGEKDANQLIPQNIRTVKCHETSLSGDKDVFLLNISTDNHWESIGGTRLISVEDNNNHIWCNIKNEAGKPIGVADILYNASKEVWGYEELYICTTKELCDEFFEFMMLNEFNAYGDVLEKRRDQNNNLCGVRLMRDNERIQMIKIEHDKNAYEVILAYVNTALAPTNWEEIVNKQFGLR